MLIVEKVEHGPKFLEIIKKIKNKEQQERIKKLIKKIIENPEVGKPMRFARKGTREVYLGSFRLSYAYFEEEKKLVFLEVYHIERAGNNRMVFLPSNIVQR